MGLKHTSQSQRKRPACPHHGADSTVQTGAVVGSGRAERVIRFEIERSWPPSTMEVRHAQQVRLLPHPD